MSKSTDARAPFQTIGVVGCGLIGCSIAAALKKRRFAGRIVGCGRAGANLQTAAARGHIDVAETDLEQAARQCELIIVCTPVDRIVAAVRVAAAACSPGTVITDAGSAKQAVCEPLAGVLPPGVTFIGSHPIAGSEKQGCAHANPDLFVNHACVLTPDNNTPRQEVERLGAFWRSLGMTVVEMTPAAHDRALAQTSHVPHVVAAALAASLADENRHLMAGGFLDTTRIAAGDPELWSAILMANAKETAAGLRAVSARLADFVRALEQADPKELAELLRMAKQIRDAIGPNGTKPHPPGPHSPGNR